MRPKLAALFNSVSVSRWPVRTGAAYLAVVAAVFLLLVLPLSDQTPPESEVVPAFGQENGEILPDSPLPQAGEEGEAAHGLRPDTLWQTITRMMESVLQRLDGALSGLDTGGLSSWYRHAVDLVLPPQISDEDLDHGMPDEPDGPGSGWLEAVLHTFDLDPRQPLSLVQGTMPVTILVSAEGFDGGTDYIVLRPVRREGETGAGQVDRPGSDWQYDGDNPLVLIYHTHTQESFLPEIFDDPGRRLPGEAFHPDPEKNVLRVGRELAEHLQGTYGIGVVHVEEYFDLPPGGDGVTKIGAYDRSYAGIQSVLERYPSIEVVLDIHRDAPRRALTTATVDGSSIAQLMLVVGTGERMTNRWDWEQNNRFAEELTGEMRAISPELVRRDPFVTEFRYNQHISPGAVLVEVGGVDNTMDEALRGIRLFGDALADLVRRQQIPPYR